MRCCCEERYYRDRRELRSFDEYSIARAPRHITHNCLACHPEFRRDYEARFYPMRLNPFLDTTAEKKPMKLTSLAKRLLDSDTRVLVEDGILDKELEITDEGIQTILAHYLQANKKALADEARARIKEAKEDK